MGYTPCPATAQRHYQREFIEWLAANRDRFGARKIRAYRTMRNLAIHVAGLNPAIEICLNSWNLGAHVFYKGTHIDCLFECDIEPRRDGDAWVCSGCDWEKGPNPLPRFATLADLRVDHQFNPFVSWYLTKLVPATVIEFTVKGHHHSWAAIRESPRREAGKKPDGTIHGNLPLWLTP